MTDFVTFGDVSNISGSLAMTIGANVVTNAKAAPMPAMTFKGNNTAGSATASDLTPLLAKAALAIANTDVSGLGTLSTQSGTFSGTHAGTSSGNNTGDQTITLTGDVTGSGVGTFGATIALLAVTTGKIAANAIDNTRIATRPALTLMGNNTGASANPADLNAGQVKTMLAVAVADVSGLGTLATQSGTFAGTHSGASSGTNTGDQTSIVGITGTKAQFNIAVTDGDVVFVGDSIPSTQLTGTVPAALLPAYTGDVTSAAGSAANVLATVNSNTGSFGLAAQIAQFTVNAKGLITAAANVAIAIASTAITDFIAAVQAVAMIATDSAQAGTAYTLASGDQYREISLTNATSCAVSIPLNASVAFPIGMRLAVWSDGAGTYSIVGVAGVTLNGISGGTRTGTLTVNLSGVRNGVVLRKTAADVWTVSGAIGAVA